MKTTLLTLDRKYKQLVELIEYFAKVDIVHFSNSYEYTIEEQVVKACDICSSIGLRRYKQVEGAVIRNDNHLPCLDRIDDLVYCLIESEEAKSDDKK